MGDVSIYDVACKSFSGQIFEKFNNENVKSLQTEEDMKAYFSKFAVTKETETNKTQGASSSKFMAKRIYKGYIDDPRNTGYLKFLIKNERLIQIF